jgi:hypothetical protein
MAIALRLNPDGSSNDNFVSLASGITGNVGTQTYSYRVKGILNALPTVAGTPGAFAFIGTTATGQGNGICVYSTGAVGLVSGNTPRYGTSAGFLSVGVPFDFTISHINTGAWTITDNLTSTVVASGTFTASTSWSGSLNNIGRLNSTTTHYLKADIELIEVTGHTNARTWDANLSGGTGDILPTTVGTNQGTLVNFTTVDADKWINYGGTAATMAAALFSLSSVSSALEANIQLMSTLASVSYISSALSAGATGLAASLQARSTAAAQATTQVRMADVLSATATATPSLSSQVRFSAQLAGVTSMTASIDVPAGNGNIAATLSTRSSLYATLLEQIQLATLAKSSATLTATIAGSAARMAAQLKNKSAVSSSFQAYKQVSFDVIGIPDGSYHTFVRDHITHEVLYDADATYSAQQLTLYVNAQSGDKVSGYVIDRLNPAENGAVLYGLVS